MQSTEAATLDRKSGVAEGSAVRLSVFPNSSCQSPTPETEVSSRPKRTRISCHAALNKTAMLGLMKSEGVVAKLIDPSLTGVRVIQSRDTAKGERRSSWE